MKKYFLASICMMLMTSSFAQSKTKQKEKAPTQKEMADMMKEMQKEMDAIDPKEKKMMDSMGFKMPDMKSIQKSTAGISDAQLKQAFEDENRIVPQKDVSRIADILRIPLSDAAITAFLQSTHEQLAGHLDLSTLESSEKIYQWLKNEYNSPTATGNAAVGLWMMGKPTVALCILSKACNDDPADADNLNNFSALLTMSGGEHLALPLLNNLNKKFPNNSTILNNIGQVWFGLGEINMADKYFDSTIRIYANHAQANLTKSLIHESKGEKAHAVEAMKRSIKEAYSRDKEERLKKLNHKLKSEDLNWDQPMPKDALGLERFNWPAYPMKVEECRLLEMEWKAFFKACEDEEAILSQKKKELEEIVVDVNMVRTKQIINAGSQGQMIEAVPPFANKAAVKLKYLIDGKDGQLEHNYKMKGEAFANGLLTAGLLEQKLNEKLKLMINAGCGAKNEAMNSFLAEANMNLQTTFTDYAGFMRRKLNDEAYYYQYTMWPEQFELAKVAIKLAWLHTIKTQMPQFRQMCVSEIPEPAGPGKFKLAQFDDIHCNYHSESNLLVGTINSDCGKLSAKLDINILKNTLGIEVVKLGIKMKQGDRDDESFWDQFQTASVELGVKKGVSAGAGPLRIEAKAGIAGRLEIGKHGITDVAIIATGEIKAGTNLIKVQDGTTTVVDNSEGPVKDQSITIVGAEAKISIVSGYTMEGKGILKGMKK